LLPGVLPSSYSKYWRAIPSTSGRDRRKRNILFETPEYTVPFNKMYPQEKLVKKR
jgi:hypothetical protein